MARVAQMPQADADDRVVPHSLDAERAVLGAALVSPSAWPVVSSAVSRGDFFRDAHARVFGAMERLAASGVSVDTITLSEELRAAGDLDEVGGRAFLAQLMDGVPRSSNAEHYAAIVREKARLRATIGIAGSVIDEAYSEAEPASGIVARAVGRMEREVSATGARPVSVAEAAAAYTRSLDEHVALIPTGYLDVDDLLGGIVPGDFMVLGARPSVGKTTMSLGIADNLAASGRVVAYFSLEMARAKIGARLLAWRSGVPTTVLERGLATGTQYVAVAAAQEALDGLPLHVHDAAHTTVVDVASWCRRIRQEQGSLAAVFIDYLQLLVPERRSSSRQEDVAGISAGLKRLAKDLGVALVALSQLSRAPEARNDKRPHASDLRESGAVEQDADVIVLLYRPEMHKPTDENKGIAEFIVSKNRTGPVGVTRLVFEPTLAQFRNLAPDGSDVEAF